tara:strand:+ start:725 stop:1267 length:543 start_codon:yes stop_codon:yes gene_type:complete
MITSLVNFLTIIRIFLALVISLLIILGDGYILALILFFIAGLSDYFDGYFARKYNATSDIGEILDPIADKILVVFILITLSVNLSSFLLAFLSSLIISREIWVSALRDYSARKNISNATKVTYLAKIKTSIQLLTIFVYLLGLAIDVMILIIFADIFLILSALITLLTGYDYTMNTLKKR